MDEWMCLVTNDEVSLENEQDHVHEGVGVCSTYASCWLCNDNITNSRCFLFKVFLGPPHTRNKLDSCVVYRTRKLYATVVFVLVILAVCFSNAHHQG
jgi:hypothetical protein